MIALAGAVHVDRRVCGRRWSTAVKPAGVALPFYVTRCPEAAGRPLPALVSSSGEDSWQLSASI
jgi:hypothetical protein